MYKINLALNNLQWLMCHKTKTKPNQTYYGIVDLSFICHMTNVLEKSFIKHSLALYKARISGIQ